MHIHIVAANVDEPKECLPKCPDLNAMFAATVWSLPLHQLHLRREVTNIKSLKKLLMDA